MASQEFLTKAYLAYFGRPVDFTGREYWSTKTEAEVIAGFSASKESQDLYGSEFDAAQVNAIYNNLFNRDAEPAGIQYWLQEVYSGRLTPPEAALGIMGGAANEDRIAVDNKLAASQMFTDGLDTTAEILGYSGADASASARAFLRGISNEPATQEDVDQAVTDAVAGRTVVGGTYMLTEGRDAITGTGSDDVFYADASQVTGSGHVANLLATGDVLDGGAGYDKLIASVFSEVNNGTLEGIYPRTTNIEEVHIEALEGNGWWSSGNDALLNWNMVLVDAGRMQGVQQFWTDNSSADLFLNDVRIGEGRVTKDITFGMRDVDTSANLYVAFDTNSIVNEGTSRVNSQVLVRVADVTTATPATPLANVNLTVGFSLDGTPIVLENIRSTDGTYAGLRTAIEEALADQGLAGLTVSFGDSYNSVTVLANTVNLPFTAQEILITDPSGMEFSNVTFDYSSIESVDQEFLVAGNAAAVEPGTLSSLIETNLILDNAGRGSTAGHVHIGGMSNSGAVIQKLNLEVDRSSKITDVYTGFGLSPNEGGIVGHARVSFEQIEVTSGARNGDLTIWNVRDVKNFDSTAFAGQNLTIGAELESTTAYVFNTANDANSNDTLWIDVFGNVAAHKNFSLSVNTGGGNDSIWLDLGLADPVGIKDAGHNPLINQKQLANAVINAGDGDNVVRTWGAGDVIITTGANNDIIYTDNSGQQQFVSMIQNPLWNPNDLNSPPQFIPDPDAEVTQHNDGYAAFVFNTVEGNRGIDNLLGNSDNRDSSLANQKAQTYDAFNLSVGVTFKGYESAFIDVESTGYRTTTAQINQAIVEAINSHPELSALIIASVDRGEALVVKSKIDGQMVLADLAVQLIAPVAVVAGETATQKAIREALGQRTVTSADLSAAGLTIDDIGANTTAAQALYATAFATDVSGHQPNVYTQTLDVTAIGSHDSTFFAGPSANQLNIGGVLVDIAAGDSSAVIAGKIAAAVTGATSVTIPGAGVFSVVAAANGTEVVFTLSGGPAVPFGEVPPAIPISALRGAEDAYLSTLEPTVGFTSSGAFSGGPGVVTPQTSVFDFAGIKIDPAGGNLTLTLSFAGQPAAVPPFAPGDVVVTIPQGAGQIQIANLVGQALESALVGAQNVTVSGTQVRVNFDFTPDATVGNPAANAGAYGVTTLTVDNPNLVITGSFPGSVSPTTAFSATNNTAVTGSVTQTLNFAGWEITEGGNLEVLGVTVALVDGLNDVAVAHAVHTALTGAGLTGVTVAPLAANSTAVSYTLAPAFGGVVPTSAAAAVQYGSGATNATILVDLAGLVLNHDAGNGGDELHFDLNGSHVTVYTATADGQGAAEAQAAMVLAGTVTLGGDVYNVTASGATSVLLTSANTGVVPVGNLTVDTDDVSLDGVAADPTVTSFVPTSGAAVGGPASVTSSVGPLAITPYDHTLFQTDLTGVDSIAESDNWVLSGAGEHDVVVLSTGEYSNEVIELQGLFGRNTIVNFDDTAPERINGGDYLDVSAYMAAGAITATTGNAGGNQVSTISFESLQGTDAGDLAVTAQMGSVTQAALATALAANYTYTGQNVFLIENNNATDAFDNFGEYLVVSTNGATVQIVGTLDFGQTISLDSGNLIQG